jgi:integrase
MARPNAPWFRESKGTWYARIDGRQTSLGVKGQDNEADALKAWHRLMANGKPELKAEAPAVAETIDTFLADAEARLKPSTAQGYREFLTPFKQQHGKVKVDRLTPAMAEAYSRKPTWSNSTRHDFLSALGIAFKWAERSGLLASNPLRHMKKPAMESRGDKAIVSEEAHAKLLEASPAYFKPFLQLLRLTGARPSEVASITAENFDEANACVRLKEHKTARHGKSRIIFLSPEAVAVLKEQKAKHESGHLVRNRLGFAYSKNAIVHMMASLRKKAGVEGTAYGYRHTFATDALANGVPDAHVSALLGHSGTAMLHRHYSHLLTRSEALRAALGKVR